MMFISCANLLRILLAICKKITPHGVLRLNLPCSCNSLMATQKMGGGFSILGEPDFEVNQHEVLTLNVCLLPSPFVSLLQDL